MEARKIAMACFIGGAFCCAVALALTPVYWWLGIIAGVAGGYVSYEFREVRKAIPIALRAAGQGSVQLWDRAKALVSKPHPFLYSGAALALPLFVFWLGPAILSDWAKGPFSSVLVVPLMFVMYCEVSFILGVFFVVPAFIGARFGERCYWWPFTILVSYPEEVAEELEAGGLRREPLNYRNFVRWFAEGLGLTILFFTWTLWVYLAIGVWMAFCFLGRFAWHLFRLVHSQKRALCAIDGTIGGVVSYVWLASSATSFPEQAVLVVFGGLLGAALGVANWEIVSKRILRLAHVRSA
ncbi:MAG: hypothetical protein WC518_04030 [Patescibacteria group bacterium]